MVKSPAGSTPLAYSSPEAVQTTGTVALGPLIGAPETPARDDVGVIGREVARHKERLAHVGLGDVRHDRGAQSVAHHRQIADIVLVELDFELLVERPSVEAGDLAIDLVH